MPTLRAPLQLWRCNKAQEDHCPPVISRADVCRTLKWINTRKAPGPDGIPGRALKVCADQLADVFADIFNMSMLQSVVPTCFKETIIVPVPKKTKILCLNDYRPVALTSTIMKCFEREEVRDLTQDNNLHLNGSKTKELIVDFRRRQREEHAPLSINGTTVERVNSFRFLGVHISEDLTWTHHTDFMTLSQSQPDSGSFFLHRLLRLNMDSRILCSFYRCTIERILTGCITAWYSSCTALNRKALQRVVKAAQHITRRQELPSMEDLLHPTDIIQALLLKHQHIPTCPVLLESLSDCLTAAGRKDLRYLSFTQRGWSSRSLKELPRAVRVSCRGWDVLFNRDDSLAIILPFPTTSTESRGHPRTELALLTSLSILLLSLSCDAAGPADYPIKDG
ncbi:hypothetical protein L3Q82_003441 [Scortum barcoo]|uniref:Uncharacterized protein n=1 Tax=Scortum barcoo TaxID=214431 RepID=A0ACB8VMC5_9TELE|nr:hypothetical protein L3Q82_003441 [Scortum barcoo]